MAALPPKYIRLSSKTPKDPGALQLMEMRDRNDHPIPFTITWCLYDRANASGRNGEMRTEKAILPHLGINSKMYRNAIRNIKLMDGRLIPVHIYLITKINDRTIL